MRRGKCYNLTNIVLMTMFYVVKRSVFKIYFQNVLVRGFGVIL